MKAVVAAFKQEKALVGAFSVITNLRMQFGCNFLKHYTWSAMMVTNLSQLQVGGRVLTEQWVDTLAVVSSLTCNAMGIAAARVTDTLRGHMKAHHICKNTMDNVDSQ